MDAELKLARLAGIQTEYTDMAGQRVRAKPETIRAILAALGFPAHSPREAEETLRMERIRSWHTMLDPVHVCRENVIRRITMRVPADSLEQIECGIVLENGAEITNAHSGEARVSAQKKVDGRNYVRCEWALPALPLGCHTLTVQAGDYWASSLLISAPVHAYSPGRQRRNWGIFVPTYALRSKQDWGVGSFGELEALGDWGGNLGAKVIASLPLTATFLGEPVSEPSPYSPASRMFWNELFIDVEKVPEFQACAKARQIASSRNHVESIARLRAQRYVDYRQVMGLKRRVLEEMARFLFTTDSPRRNELLQHLKTNPRLKDYAEFRAVCERTRCSWHCWEPRMRNGKLQVEDFSMRDWQYHCYVQWIAEQQVEALSQAFARKGSELYLDLPLGVHPDSYDLWREKDYFALETSVGAPPDAFFSKGQNWGFSPLHPVRIRQRGYGFVREFLRCQMRHASMLRVDHVMGLHRLYCIPQGFPNSQGAYVSYPAEEFYALFCLESVRSKTVLVGENLGTVPPEVNRALRRHRLRRMYVLPFEQRVGKRRVLPEPAADCVASINTHDMPTFAAHVTGGDIADRAEMGLLGKTEVRKEQASRVQRMKDLRRFLQRKKVLEPGDESVEGLFKACVLWLARSPAETVLLNLEDFWGEVEPQNVPGTSSEKPNWKRKLRFPLEEIRKKSGLEDFLRQLNRER